MNLRSFVKVGNISNLSDARYSAGFGVNLLGFNVDPSQPDAITWETAKEMIVWVEVEGIVLECGVMSTSAILELKDLSGINYYQTDRLDVAQDLLSKNISVIFRVLIGAETSFDQMENDIKSAPDGLKYIIIESDDDNLSEDLDQMVTRLSSQIPLLKGFNVTTETISTVVSNTSNYDGIALKGSQEEKPGFKDYDELADILEELELELED